MSVMKTPVNGPECAITLFRDVDFCYASGLCIRVIHLIPVKHQNDVGIYSAAIFLIPICISFDTAEKRRYATYLILNRRFSFGF